MSNIDFELSKREVTETKAFVTIEGEEFELSMALEFLEEIKETDGYMSWAVPDYREKDFAIFLEKQDYIRRKTNGGMFDNDSRCEKLHNRLEVQYYKQFIEE